MRITVRVGPGASRTRVGGEYDGALVVRVGASAVDGQATAAALKAIADALGIAAREVVLISGATSRAKVVQVSDSAAAAVNALLAGCG